MLLAIDAGNTNVEFAVFENNHLCAQWRASSSMIRTCDEWASWLIPLMGLSGIDHSKIRHSIISCVVPDLLWDLTELSRRHFGHAAMVVGQDKLDLGILSMVDHPEEVGADLLVGCAAVKKLYGGPALILDMGTATTLSLLDHHGNFAGVAIAPGLKMSLESLSLSAARLPHVFWDKTDRVIGTNTISAMQGGIYWGYLGLVENLIRHAKDQYLEQHPESELKVVATGGLARYIMQETSLVDHYDEDLGLKGLQIIAHANMAEPYKIAI